ncbi:TPA: hypothetical protein EYO57_02690, partial [Candidatus Poribacteria bacterium]|nr:hypothetical protein [Candidatus Poribacteria bacterium]
MSFSQFLYHARMCSAICRCNPDGQYARMLFLCVVELARQDEFGKYAPGANMVLHGIDYAIIVIYLVGVLSLGFYIGRKMKTGDDYFLAGRSLPWWAIGMSLVVTDIGAVDMVAIAGSAYLYGIVMGNFDWLGSVPVMIIGAFIFIPMFWRARVTTIPEWLGLRYSFSVRTVVALIWGGVLSISLG